MAQKLRSKDDVLTLMRKLGMVDAIPEADRVLPDVIDLDRDGEALRKLGLDVDLAVDRLGGSAW